MGRGSKEITVAEGASLRNQRAYYSIKGFASYEDLEEFCRLIEYAQRGRVIVDWRPVEQDELQPGEEDEEYPPEDAPIYDDTDRSHEPRYVLAEALMSAGMFDFFVNDVDERTPFLRVNTAFPQDELLSDAASKTDLALARQE